MQKTRNVDRDSGFTLIELLVVIVILGVLTSIAVLTTSQARAAAVEKACMATAQNIGAALETYNSQWNEYPIGAGAALNQGEFQSTLGPYIGSTNLNVGASGAQAYWFNVSTTKAAYTIQGYKKDSNEIIEPCIRRSGS